MRQRGRKSGAALVALPNNVDGSPSRLEPPADLLDDERALFLRLINAASAHHFAATDEPILTSFVQCTLLVRSLANKPTKIDAWEKAVRAQTLLARSLRLTPQSRMDPKTLARKQQEWTGPTPWGVLKNDKT
jgi:hypothetical protein